MKQHRSKRSKLKPKCEITICSLQWLQVKRSVGAMDEKNREELQFSIDEKNGEELQFSQPGSREAKLWNHLKNIFVFSHMVGYILMNLT